MRENKNEGKKKDAEEKRKRKNEGKRPESRFSLT